MRRPGRLEAAVLINVLVAGGCAMTAEQQQQAGGTVMGGLIGAGTGALIGGLTGGPRGAAIGAAAGGVTGAVVGWGAVKIAQYNAQQSGSANEVNRAYGYDRAQGTVVRMRGAQAEPVQAHRGAPVDFVTDYAVLAPPGTSVAVTETWELWKDGSVLSSMPPQQVQRQPGGWVARASIPVPGDAAPGTYVVKHRVVAGSSYDERESHFVVDAGRAPRHAAIENGAASGS